MKKIYLAFLAAILFSATCFSQSANYYVFAAGSGATLDPMTGAATIVPANSKDTSSALLTIPFTFLYEGRSYTQFAASPHGLLKLGDIVPTTTFSNNVFGGNTMLFPFWDGLNTGPTGSVSYVVTGSAPGRILKIQWFLPIPYNSSANANSTMQAWLYETSGVVEFRYGAGVGPASSASIGINGVTSSNFIAVTTPANTASNQNSNDFNKAWPGAGTIYTFTPPVVSACTRPASQPTSLTAPDKFPTAIGGYFNAASNNPTGYLVVKSVGAFTGTPVDGNEYSQGNTIGNGTVVQSGSTLSYTATGLTGNTQYTITVFSYNAGLCSGGPLYNTTSAPTATARTCTALPGSPNASNLTTSSALLKWTSSAGGGALPITYTVDVATNNSFTTPVTGSPFTINSPDTALNLSGLAENTTYYYRVNTTGTCQTVITYSFSTVCSPAAMPYVENFDAATASGLPNCTRSEDLKGGTAWTTTTVPGKYTGNVLRYTHFSNFFSNSDWFYTQGITLTAGTSYTLGFKYGSDSVAFKTGFQDVPVRISYGTNPIASAMTTSLATKTTKPAPQSTAITFLPPATGTYYFGFNPNQDLFSNSYQNELYIDSIVILKTGTSLPVTLTNFTAVRNGSVNNISWTTTEELNTSRFVIERSNDGQTYNAIGQVSAAGNSNTEHSYHFTDASPAAGTNYYRIKIVDRDDNTKLSDVKSVRNTGKANFTLYPNPVTDVVKVDMNAVKADKGAITITDINGSLLYKSQINIVTGNNKFNINISNFERGTYLIKVQLSDDIIVNKVTKM